MKKAITFILTVATIALLAMFEVKFVEYWRTGNPWFYVAAGACFAVMMTVICLNNTINRVSGRREMMFTAACVVFFVLQALTVARDRNSAIDEAKWIAAYEIGVETIVGVDYETKVQLYENGPDCGFAILAEPRAAKNVVTLDEVLSDDNTLYVSDAAYASDFAYYVRDAVECGRCIWAIAAIGLATVVARTGIFAVAYWRRRTIGD